jgi:hypothetical protein
MTARNRAMDPATASRARPSSMAPQRRSDSSCASLLGDSEASACLLLQPPISREAVFRMLDHAVQLASALDVRAWVLEYADHLARGSHAAACDDACSNMGNMAPPASYESRSHLHFRGGSASARPRTAYERSQSPPAVAPASRTSASHPRQDETVKSGVGSVLSSSFTRCDNAGRRSARSISHNNSGLSTSASAEKWTSVVAAACRQLHTLASPMRLRMEALHNVSSAASELRVDLVRSHCQSPSSPVSTITTRLLPLLTHQLSSGEKHVAKLVLDCLGKIADIFGGGCFFRCMGEAARQTMSSLVLLAAGRTHAVLTEVRELIAALIGGRRLAGDEPHLVRLLFTVLQKEEDDEDVEIDHGSHLLRALLLLLLHRLYFKEGGFELTMGDGEVSDVVTPAHFRYALGHTVSTHAYALPFGPSEDLFFTRSNDHHDDSCESQTANTHQRLVGALRETLMDHHQHSRGEKVTLLAVRGTSSAIERAVQSDEELLPSCSIATKVLERLFPLRSPTRHDPFQGPLPSERPMHSTDKARGLQTCSTSLSALRNIPPHEMDHNRAPEEEDEPFRHQPLPQEAFSSSVAAKHNGFRRRLEIGLHVFRAVVAPLLRRGGAWNMKNQKEPVERLPVERSADMTMDRWPTPSDIALVFSLWFPSATSEILSSEAELSLATSRLADAHVLFRRAFQETVHLADGRERPDGGDGATPALHLFHELGFCGALVCPKRLESQSADDGESEKVTSRSSSQEYSVKILIFQRVTGRQHRHRH